MSGTLVAKVKGGPVTESGKAVARLNGVVHGLRAIVPVITTERQEEWDLHRAGIVDELSPMGALEMELTERVALLLWRLRRVARYETDAISGDQADAEEDHVQHERLFGHTERFVSTWPSDMRGEIKDLAARARALKRLATMPDDTRVRSDDVRGILYSFDHAASRHDKEFTFENVSLPGIPDDCDLDDAPNLMAAQLRAGIVNIAKAVQVAPEELTEEVLYELESDVRGTKYRLEVADKKVARMRATRALPNEKTLDRIMRYEAHLHRQLVQTLRELEAMQSRRAGQSTPLARLDVSGIET